MAACIRYNRLRISLERFESNLDHKFSFAPDWLYVVSPGDNQDPLSLVLSCVVKIGPMITKRIATVIP